jgi:phosphoribosyl 1,2-cyclic phosphate phosphodiesterase
MELTVLGSGGCTVIPKPLCSCSICKEARGKGVPYERTGPSAFLHDANLLIDTPAEIAQQLNRSRIDHIDAVLLTHLDPDHVEGFRVVEQVTLDFRTWEAYPGTQIKLLLPEALSKRLESIQSHYGPLIDYYEQQGFVLRALFREKVNLGQVEITAIPVDRGSQTSYIYVFVKDGCKVVYASCDIKPFPDHREEVLNADVLIIQPGIFEDGLKHNFTYGGDHISRTTLYTFEETMALAEKIQSGRIVFVHLEEYWNRSYDDYLALEKQFDHMSFAYDGMRIVV